MALMLPILIGFVGLAIDVGAWQAEKRNMQGAVDRAAYSAATAAVGGATKSQAIVEAKAEMASAGYSDGLGGVAITVNNPASAGSFASDPTSWEVIATKPQSLYFSAIFLSQAPSVSVRAVAVKGSKPSPGCILTLDPAASYATTFTNNAQVTDPACAVYTNSSSANALLCDNNCSIASDTYTVGGNLVTNHGTLAGKTNATGVPITPDPYASVPVPSSASLPCTYTSTVTIKSNQVINPGVYCGGINVNANNVLTLNPGTYYIKKFFNMGGNSVLQATDGVTLVLLDDACLGDGTCKKEKGLGNNITVNLTAPTSGTYAGIAIYAQGIKDTYQEFNNNAALNIQGAIYAPGDSLNFHNNALFNSNMCAQIVAGRVYFENNATMGTDCANTGVNTIVGKGNGKKTKLVE